MKEESLESKKSEVRSQKWEFSDTVYNSGKFNMDYDMELVERCRKENVSFLRFYGWEPYCISLGYNQTKNNGEPLNYSKCKNDGIDIVTRPTGGRAVLHAEELTYSVILRTNKSAQEVYSEISSALLTGLKLIDELNERLQKISAVKESRVPGTGLISGKNNICFASSVKNEINYLGKKIVGSAQRKFHDVILQHGSVLIGEEHKNIVKYLNESDENLIDIMKNEMDVMTVCLNEILEREVSYEEVGEAILKGFKKYFNVSKFRILPMSFGGMTKVRTA